MPTIAGNDPTIASAYDIDGTTAIRTDPFITTQGVKSEGRIYRGSDSADGLPSSYFLGASNPTTFDNTTGFNAQFDNGSQIGAFKFNSLNILAAPASISTASGPTQLAFIAIGGINTLLTSSASIDLSGIGQTLFATQNGAITLDQNLTFTNTTSSANGTSSLTLYARGSGNVLRVGSTLNLDGDLSFYGQGGITYTQNASAPKANSATFISGDTLNLNGQITTTASAASNPFIVANSNTTLGVGGNAVLQSPSISLMSVGNLQIGGTITTSGDLNIDSLSGDLSTTSNASLTAHNIFAANLGGAVSLDGVVHFTGNLTTSNGPSNTGDITIAGAITGIGSDGTPGPFGFAQFATNKGDVAITGSVQAGSVYFTTDDGNYSTGSTGTVTSPNVRVSAPKGTITLTRAAYPVPSGDVSSILMFSGQNITVTDTNFTPDPSQYFRLTQPGVFSIPDSSSYTFDSLTLTQPGTAANPGNLTLGNGSGLSVDSLNIGGSLTMTTNSHLTVNGAIIGETVTLNGASSLDYLGTGEFFVTNTSNAANGFTITGSPTITLGIQNVGGLLPAIIVAQGNFDAGGSTIIGYSGSVIEVPNGSFTSTGSVNVATLTIGGAINVSGALVAGTFDSNEIFTGGTLTSGGDIIVGGLLMAGTVTPVAGATVNTGDYSVQTFSGGDTLNVGGTVYAVQNRSLAQTITVPQFTSLSGVDLSRIFIGGGFNYVDGGKGGNLTLTVSTPLYVGPGSNLGGTSVIHGSPSSLPAGTTSFLGNSTAVGTNHDATFGPGGPGGDGGTLAFVVHSNANDGGTFVFGTFDDSGETANLTVSGGAYNSSGEAGIGGKGGTLSATADSNISIFSPAAMSSLGGNFYTAATVNGSATDVAASGAGGTIKLNAGGELLLGGGITLQADGGDTLYNGSSFVGTNGAPGGFTSNIPLTAGAGGTITLHATGPLVIGDGESSTNIQAQGGNNGAIGMAGGNGGTINITSDVTGDGVPAININTANITTTTGVNGNGLTNGGRGGTINITTTDTPSANPSDTPEPSILVRNASLIASDTGTGSLKSGSYSQVGGAINITSDRTAGPGILIQNSSTLRADIASDSFGAGGTVSLLTNGAMIEVDNSTISGGLVTLNTQTVPDSTYYFSTSITLSGATITGDEVKFLTAGPNDYFYIDGNSSVAAGESLTINAVNPQIGGNGTTDLSANNLVGTITVDTVNTDAGGDISIVNATMEAYTINLDAQGPGGMIIIGNLPSAGITAQYSLTLNAAKISLFDSNLSVASGIGTLILDTLDANQRGSVTIDSSSLTANAIRIDSQGVGGGVIIQNTSSVTAGQGYLNIGASNVQILGSSVRADDTAADMTIDTTDPNQDGTVNIDSSALSARNITITARGDNGLITTEGTNASNLAALAAANGNLTLQALGSNGSITIGPDSTLQAANGTLELLAFGGNGLITLGATGSGNDATNLSADMLKMRATGASGSIVINAGSTLSATTQLKLYADGSNGSITFQGGNITLSTGALAGILAAPTITIKTGTVVTVTGSAPLQVYTTTANYASASGGNGGMETGTFAGTAMPMGTPMPFANAPAYAPAGSLAGVSRSAALTVTAPAGVLVGPAIPASVKTGRKSNPPGRVVGGALRLGPTHGAIPFSALNPKDLSYDHGLLDRGSGTTSTAKAGRKALPMPGTGVSATGRNRLAGSGATLAGAGITRPDNKRQVNPPANVAQPLHLSR